jgi:hypothetical protein
MRRKELQQMTVNHNFRKRRERGGQIKPSKPGYEVTVTPKSQALASNYSKKDAATILGISPRTMDYLVAYRKIEHFRIGRRLLFTSAQIVRFIEKNTIGAVS